MVRNRINIIATGALLLLLGCDPSALISPEQSSSETLSLHSEMVANQMNQAAERSTDVYTFADGSVVGSSSLNRHGNSVSMTIHTTGFPSGMAVTVWWVVFNHPENCTAPTPVSQCGEADIFDPAVRADVLYAAGHVIGAGNHINFAAQLKVGDASGSIMAFFNALLGLDLPSVGLENLDGSEIHLVVRTHQQALPSHMPDMISTFNGGCIYPEGTPTDFGKPGPNTCSDIQFAVHQP